VIIQTNKPNPKLFSILNAECTTVQIHGYNEIIILMPDLSVTRKLSHSGVAEVIFCYRKMYSLFQKVYGSLYFEMYKTGYTTFYRISNKVLHRAKHNTTAAC